MEKISDNIKNTINQSGKITINPFGINYYNNNLSLLPKEYSVYKALINFNSKIEYNFSSNDKYDILFLFDDSEYYIYDIIFPLENFIIKKYSKSILVSDVATSDINSVLNNINIFLIDRVNDFPTNNIFNKMSLGMYSNNLIIFNDYILNNIGSTI